MSSEVKREDLLKTLESVAGGLADREIIEQSTCFILQGSMVKTFSDEVYCQAPSGLDGIEGAVQAKQLLELLNKLDDEVLTLRQEEGSLVIKGARKRSRIRMEPDIVLPVDKVTVPEKFRKLHESFCDALSVVGQCAGKDQSMFVTVCIHLHPGWVEAFDNFQLCRWPMKTGLRSAVLVKHSALKHVVPLGVDRFAEDESWIHFKSGDVVVSCRRYVEDYHDLTPFLDVDGAEVSLPDAVAKAADRAQIFTEDDDQKRVTVTIRSNKIKVSGEGAVGSYEEFTERSTYEGAPIAFLISPKLLADIVARKVPCKVTSERLKVENSSYQYVTCLRAVPNGKGEG